MKWILKLKNRFLSKKDEENAENQKESWIKRILGFIKTLNFQCIKIIVKICDSRAISFIKEKWEGETDIYELFLLYRELNLENINNKVNEYYRLSSKIFTYNEAFNQLKQDLSYIKKEKIDMDTGEIEEEINKLDMQINELNQSRDSILKMLSNMGHKRKNVIIGLEANDGQFTVEYIKNNHKIVIVYIVLALISAIYFWININEYGAGGLVVWLIAFTWGYYQIVYKIGLSSIRRHVDENENLKIIIKNDYKDAFKRATLYGKEKKDEEPKLIIMEKAEQNLKPYPVQQLMQEQQVYNPYTDMWNKVNEKYFNLKNFKIPEYEELELIERHIIHDFDLKEDKVIDAKENIEKYRGKPIHNIKNENGKIIVDFLIGEFPDMVKFYEVPEVDENSIVVGKSVEGWVTWDLEKVPHGAIIGTTGSGKSNTVRFIFNEVRKKNWLPYMIDFKGGADYYFLEEKYKLITDVEGFVDFIKELYGELGYRQKLFKDFRTSSFKKINKSLKEKGENPIARLVIFIDEFAVISSLQKDIKNSIIRTIEQLAQRGRSFGINLILIVQKPTAENLGSSYIRSLTGVKIIGKLEDETDYRMAFGVSNNLSGEDKLFAIKLKNDKDFIGKFIVKGGNTGHNVLVRVPYMDEEEYDEMVLNEWEDNEYSDYKLHSLEDNEAEEYEEKPVSKVDIQKLKKFGEKYAKDDVEKIQDEYDTYSTDFDVTDFIDL